jgi:hypothetical protein
MRKLRRSSDGTEPTNSGSPSLTGDHPVLHEWYGPPRQCKTVTTSLPRRKGRPNRFVYILKSIKRPAEYYWIA